MGLFNDLCKTYDTFANTAGIIKENSQVLLPIGHDFVISDIEITLNAKGEFVAAKKLDEKFTIIIPQTIESAGRSGQKAYAFPHPLCDQLKYLTQENSRKPYLIQLENWMNSEYNHPFLKPVFNYIQNNSILNDLNRSGLKAEEKTLICWRIIGLNLEHEVCYQNPELFQSFTNWYIDSLKDKEKGFDMITGEETVLCNNHSKKLTPSGANAKLISANPGAFIVYQGRFLANNPNQALSIGYESSQKAHLALKWLISRQSSYQSFSKTSFICWNPEGKKIPVPTLPLIGRINDVIEPTSYEEALSKTLRGYQCDLLGQNNHVILAGFDAAIPGRLSITYYNKLNAGDYLNRLYNWDKSCCWVNGKFGVQSPLLYKIVLYAFGTYRVDSQGKGKFEVSNKVQDQHVKRLIACRVDQVSFPLDIERALVNKIQNLQIYDNSTRQSLLFLTCAVIRKFYIDKFKEEWKMALDETNNDRSYLFGRLLALLEKAEKDTYHIDSEKERETNAIRYLPRYVRQPMKTFTDLIEQLKKAYYPKLNSGRKRFYEKQIGKIIELLDTSSSEINNPLEDTYVLGYYLQKNELYKSKKDSDINEKGEKNNE